MHKGKSRVVKFLIGVIIFIIVLALLGVIGSTKAASKEWTDGDAEMLAKTVWGEARGLSDYERSLVVWCILNRYEDGSFGKTIQEVITKPYQFQGYKESFPVDEDILTLCRDVLNRWANDEEGRTLPKEYLYFYGDGKHNYYTTDFQGGSKYDFSLPDPYGNNNVTFTQFEKVEEKNMEDQIEKEIQRKIEELRTSIGAMVECVTEYRKQLDKTPLDEATKLALTLDFQRAFLTGGFKNG